jgi:BolA protein
MSAVAEYLEKHLKDAFSPTSLEVINESHLHSGHAGDNGTGESHFRIRIVARAFNNMNRVQRHRAINAVVQPKIDEGLHACAIEVKGVGE